MYRPDLQKTFSTQKEEKLIEIYEWLISYGFKEMGIIEVLPKLTEIARAQLDRLRGTNSGINIFGYLNRVSGLGEMARRTKNALEKNMVAVSEVSIPILNQPFLKRKSSFVGLNNQAHQDKNLYILNPSEYNYLSSVISKSFLIKKAKKIAYVVWETAGIPKSFENFIKECDIVIVPSGYVAENIYRNFGIMPKVVPIPTRKIADNTRVLETNLRYPLENRFFFTGFDTLSDFDRKNPTGVLNAFIKAFPARNNSTNPDLIIKVMNPEVQSKNMSKLKQISDSHPNVKFITNVLSESELDFITQNALAFISTHRAEGYGLFLLDAMSQGCLTIGTNYSGTKEFMNAENSVLIPAKVVSIPPSSIYFQRNSEFNYWADPDLDFLIETLRKVACADLDFRTIRGKALRDLESYNPQLVGYKLKELISN
jgi:glycosyltransferase involved in cell wall biosynthesis